MTQSDWILRVIEQAGMILVELRNRILGRTTDRQEVDRTLASALGDARLDLSLARGADAETLALLVAPTGEVEPGRCWLVAEVLYLDGLQASLEEREEEARASLLKARRLYGLLEPGSLTLELPEARERLDEIEALLGELGEDGA